MYKNINNLCEHQEEKQEEKEGNMVWLCCIIITKPKTTTVLLFSYIYFAKDIFYNYYIKKMKILIRNEKYKINV